MKTFVAGAPGALGRRLVRATPVVLDALDRDAVIDTRTGGPIKTEDDPFDPPGWLGCSWESTGWS
jgi:hypothetical protein